MKKNLKTLMLLMLVLVFSCNENKNMPADEDIYDADEFSDTDVDQDISEEESCEDKKYDEWDLNFEGISVYKIKVLDDGNYFFRGAWNEFQDPWHVSFSMVGNLNPDFTVKWGVIFDEESYGKNFNDFEMATSGKVYTVGTKGRNTFWAASFLENGDIEWEKEWKYDGFYKLGSAILNSVSIYGESLYMAGFTAGWNEEGKATFPELYLAKTDLEGNLLWEKVWGPGGSLITDIKIDDERGIYLSGYTTGDIGENGNAGNIGDCDGALQIGPVGESSCPDPFLIKTDGDGNVLWKRQWGTDALAIELSKRIIIKNNDIFVLSEVMNKDNVGLLSVAKFNKGGDVLFNNNYVENGRDFSERGDAIYFDKNGTLIVGGFSRELELPKEGYLLAINSENGDKIDDIRFVGENSGLNVSAIYEDDEGLKFAGYEQTGEYEPQPGDVYPVYRYGMKDVGYFYLDPKPDTTITNGSDFERETVETGSEKDDEIVFSFTDSDGNLFVAGNTWGDIGGNKNKGEKDVFAAKYKADGTPEWIKNFGSSDWDSVSDGAVDSEGNIVLTGTTWGEFEGNERLGISDVFVIKIDLSGDLLWSSIAGSNVDEWAEKMFIDESDDIYVAGGGHGPFEGEKYESGFGYNIFVGRWKSSGEKDIFRMYGPRMDGISVAADSDNVYLVGTVDVDFADQTVYDTGVNDNIILKVDKNFDLQWARIWGSEERDSPTDIAIDSSGDIYVSGYTFGPMEGNIYLGENCPGGFCPDAYLTKWNSEGEQLWIRQFGTENGDRAYSLAINENDEIYVSGTADKNILCKIESDIFLIKSDTSGNLDEIKIWGTAGEDKVNNINYSNGKLIISGFTTGGLDENENQGGEDGFVTIKEQPN